MDSAVHYQDALQFASEQYYAGVQGHLWVPSSNLEVQSVIDLKQAFHSDGVWIAVSDTDTEGQWIATAGPYNGTDLSDLIYWRNSEPGGGIVENCVVIDDTYQARDYVCADTNSKYIVEFECSRGKRFNDQGTACVGMHGSMRPSIE